MLVRLVVALAAVGLTQAVHFGQADLDWSRLDRLLGEAVAGHSFPGCVALVGNRQGIQYQKAFGHFTYGQPAPENHGGNPAVSEDTLFDLASLTKVRCTDRSRGLVPCSRESTLHSPLPKQVLATTTAAMTFYQRGELDVYMPVASPKLLGPRFAVNGKDGVLGMSFLNSRGKSFCHRSHQSLLYL